MDFDIFDFAYTASTWVLPVLVAITFHEAAHGFVAWRLGDDTAYRMGRVTFNPLRHVDTFGTIILPASLLILQVGFVFGWAKPVPVAFHRLRRMRRDMVLVAAAGPGINLGLAVISAVLLNFGSMVSEPLATWLVTNLFHSILINLLLAIFNMLPLPPLDGGRVAVGLLPRSLAFPLARMERYGLFVIIGAIFLLPYLGDEIGVDLNLFGWIILGPLEWLLPHFVALGGLF